MTSGKILLKQGGHIGFQQWGSHHPKKVLAVHGWLDNSNSFTYLGPYLANLGYHVYALDLIGHGHSYHFHKDSSYNFLAYLSSIREVVDSIGWTRSSVIGHSMGGSVMSTFAAAFPERVDSLVMIDGFGPFTRPANKTLANIRQRLEYDLKIANRKSTPRKSYPTLEDAINARVKNVASFPGKQFISKEAAFKLVSRGTILVDGNHHSDHHLDHHITDLNAGPVCFRHDLGLMRPQYYYLTNDQSIAIMQGIICPTLLVTAEFGWPPGDPAEIASRKKVLVDKGLLESHEVPGTSHHLHLDPSSAPVVANIIGNFLNKHITEDTQTEKPKPAHEPIEFFGE